MRRSHLVQKVLPGPQKVDVSWYSSMELVEVARVIGNKKSNIVSVAVALSARGDVVAIAFATPHQVIHVFWDATNSVPRPMEKSCIQNIFRSSTTTFVAFDMAHVLLLIRETFKCRPAGVDLSTLGLPPEAVPVSPGAFIQSRVSSVSQREVHNIWERLREDEEKHLKLAYKAWIAAIAAKLARKEIPLARRLDSSVVPEYGMSVLGPLVKSIWLLHEMIDLEKGGEFSKVKLTVQGDIVVENARYKNRVRKSKNTTVELLTDEAYQLQGSAVGVSGRSTTLRALSSDGFSQLIGQVEDIRILGREEETSADKARDVLLRRILQRDFKLEESPFISRVWFPSSLRVNIQHTMSGSTCDRGDLNQSQHKVVSSMISSLERDALVIVHGPPGTGKTTTIARAAQEWATKGEAAWITAQKNVAVKNIASSLAKQGVDFRLLVSPEFYNGWHEHLYTPFKEQMVLINMLPKDDLQALRKMLGSTSIVLCPISMLSNPILDGCGIYHLIPVTNLVVDEASQIQVFDYVHVFHRFSEALQKACFFGDPQQLPPYGQEVASLRSIFDVEHLKPASHFLDVQYRMPASLGRFISENIYDFKLVSHRQHAGVNPVVFIDVASGCEVRDGTSWLNLAEAEVATHIAGRYYRNKDFAIITPYDPQRAVISKLLKGAGLPDNVFTVDSFQGHEKDFIIVSSVRTDKAGFLSSRYRMNVMLSRCKDGMILVTNRRFLRATNEGAKTLLGRLADSWEMQHGTERTWVPLKSVEELEADLPGVPGPNRPPRKPLPHPVAERPVPADAPRSLAVISSSVIQKANAFSSLPLPGSSAASKSLLQGRWKSGFDPALSPPPTISTEIAKDDARGREFAEEAIAFPDLPLTESGDTVTSKLRLQGRWKNGSNPLLSPPLPNFPPVESYWPF